MSLLLELNFLSYYKYLMLLYLHTFWKHKQILHHQNLDRIRIYKNKECIENLKYFSIFKQIKEIDSFINKITMSS